MVAESYSKNVLGSNYNLLEMLKFKQANNLHESKQENANSEFTIIRLNGELDNLFEALPFAFVNAVFSPLFTDVHSKVQILPFLEAIFLIVLLLMFCLFPSNILDTNLLIFVFLFCIVAFLFFGLLVPVIGNLVIYRSPFLFLVYFFLVSNIDLNRMKNEILYLKRLIKIR